MDNAFSPEALQSLLKTDTIGRCVLHLTSTGSTMDVARQEAESGAPDGTIVVADRQTAGKGRRGRPWVSPPGNLYVTIILRPSELNVRTLPVVAPLAACEAIEAVADVRALIKWPNDVLIEGRKVAGVLIDAHLAEREACYALVGIGVNISLDPSKHGEIQDTATSLAGLGQKVLREGLLAALLNRFERLYAAAARDDSVRQSWRDRLETLGRQVIVQLGNQVEAGVAEDVDADGNLLLRRDDGSIVALSAGDVSLTDA